MPIPQPRRQIHTRETEPASQTTRLLDEAELIDRKPFKRPRAAT